MTKKKSAIIAIALILCAVVVFAAACIEEEMTVNDAFNVLAQTSSGVGVADVTVTVTDSNTNTVIYSYPEAADVPAEIQGVVSGFVPDMNGGSTFNYDSLNFSDTTLSFAEGSATLSGSISNPNSFLGTQGMMYNSGAITATIDTVTMRASAVDITYTYVGNSSNFNVAISAAHNY